MIVPKKLVSGAFRFDCVFKHLLIFSMANIDESIVWLSTLFEVVSNGVKELAANLTEAQQTTQRFEEESL